MVISTSVVNSNPPDPNNKLRTVYIWSLTSNVEWPESSRSGDFVIGIYGTTELSDDLIKSYSQRKAGNQQVVVKIYDNISKVDPCQILYVAPDKNGDVQTLATKFAGKPVLIIAEKEGMAKKGLATLNFVFRENALKFAINKENAEKHNLKIGLSLINIAVEAN
jgi:hypothetical protein